MKRLKYAGLASGEAEESRRKYGSNRLTHIKPEPVIVKLLKGFLDPMIMILVVAFSVQVVLCFFGKAQWFEPVGVFIAILIANGVASVSQSMQEGKASALKEEEEARETAKVFRDGKLQEIKAADVVVGDVLFLQAGDRIDADGEIIEGEIQVDQSVLNGETEEAEKYPDPGGRDPDDLLSPGYVFRGTVVCSSECCVRVTTVGDKTMFGALALEVQEEKRKTPLQIKLGKLAKGISVFGYVGAALIVAAVILEAVISGRTPQSGGDWLALIIDALTVAITIIVCAVPEGLPMLTSVLMSIQSVKMARDNVLVKNINGIETAGSLSLLFTDKTGTITEGKLRVSELILGNMEVIGKLEDIPTCLRRDIALSMGVNNSAYYSEGKVIGGNSTERALMTYLAENNCAEPPEDVEIRKFNAFDSSKKYSSVLVRDGDAAIKYIKGAPEKIISRCRYCLDEKGEKREFSDKEKIKKLISEKAAGAMRLLATAKCEEGSEDELTLVCVLSIRDSVRKEAAAAIKEVQSAGIQVVMITGDRKETAAAVARESGLISAADDIAITSQELSEMTDDQLKEMLPRLRVISRALPSDKSRLVRVAQEMELVVGMTGDGVNDSPALKKADVGFAMGSGTEVAKSAGDITILDDNFLSIKKAILYGRTMFRTIRKFLIFQLTVNVAAVLICFAGPILGRGAEEYNVILTVVQLLMINLAMDTLAAIAFGSEPPREIYMKARPVPRNESILSVSMMGEILLASLYITAVCLSVLFVPQISGLVCAGQDIHNNPVYLRSALFAVFMMAIAFNGFNARTERINIIKGIGKNKTFLLVMLGILIMQFVFVSFGGDFLSVQALTPGSWLICLFASLMVIPVDIFRKAIIHLKNGE